jgi:micrococcal nuclease
VIVAGAFGLLVAVRSACDLWWREDRPRIDEPLAEGVYVVERVVDGDTIVVSTKFTSEAPHGREPRARNVRVRLIGINAPESVTPNHPVEPFGPEAADFTRQFLVDGEATLRFDHCRLDKYGRWRAYVFVDDVMLNEELVRQGLAWVDHYRGDNTSLARRIRKAEAEARAASRGLWADGQTP